VRRRRHGRGRAVRDPLTRTEPVAGSREQAKRDTRDRLLAAGLRLLDESGETALTTTAVTRLAGIAQSSFYVHFDDTADLVRALVEQLSEERLRVTRAAREASRAAPRDLEHFRRTFRVPMEHSVAHPRLFRLLVRSRTDRTTPLGAWSRRVLEESRSALVADLVASGMPSRTAVEQRRVEMVADGLIALTETLTLGHLEGRYPDLEEAVDVLVAFSRGYAPLLRPQAGR
jgi:AcrR family transcriptional regulator